MKKITKTFKKLITTKEIESLKKDSQESFLKTTPNQNKIK